MAGLFEVPGLPELPADVTLEEVAGTLRGRPIMRNGVNVAQGLEWSDQLVEAVLAAAGIEMDDDEDDEDLE